MISYIRGKVIQKAADHAIIEANGLGYEISLCEASIRSLPVEGSEVHVFVAESISMYGGTALYGFLSAEEKDLFELFRDAVPNTGAKKALEYLNKALKSLPDFKRAVIQNDLKLLTTIFGFTSKTADKLISALKYKMPDFETSGEEKIRRPMRDGVYAQALNALGTLGFKPGEARAALEESMAEEAASSDGAEQLLKRALKKLSPK